MTRFRPGDRVVCAVSEIDPLSSESLPVGTIGKVIHLGKFDPKDFVRIRLHGSKDKTGGLYAPERWRKVGEP